MSGPHVIFEGCLAKTLRLRASNNLIFEGCLAEMLRFCASKLHFWRKSRRNASFLIFKAWFWKDVSQKSFVLFWSVKASFLKEVSQKSFVSELLSFNFEGGLAEKLRCCWHVHVSPAWQLTLADRFLIAALRCVRKTAQSVCQLVS